MPTIEKLASCNSKQIYPRYVISKIGVRFECLIVYHGCSFPTSKNRRYTKSVTGHQKLWISPTNVPSELFAFCIIR